MAKYSDHVFICPDVDHVIDHVFKQCDLSIRNIWVTKLWQSSPNDIQYQRRCRLNNIYITLAKFNTEP